MSNKVKIPLYILIFVIFIVMTVLLYNRLTENADSTLSVETEQGEIQSGDEDKVEAPDFTVFDKDGNEMKLSDTEGTPVVLNFWASWCPPCKEEMPHFDLLHEELGDDVKFMMVDLVDGRRETVETGDEYITEQGFSFPVFFDTNQEAAYTYGIRSIPTTLFIDKDGYIITGAKGAIDEETLRRGIDMIK